MRLVVALVFLAIGCDTSDPLHPAPCNADLQPGDFGIQSRPCKGVPGVSYDCYAVPSQVRLGVCQIIGGSFCVAVCPPP